MIGSINQKLANKQEKPPKSYDLGSLAIKV